MRKFDLSLRSSRSSYFATFRHQLTILSKTDALDEEKWLNMLGTFVKDWFRYESHFVHGRDSLVDILKERGLLSNQKELTKMQLDNQKEIAEMQNETQKEIAGIQSATSRQNTKDQVYAQNEMLAYQQKESTARVASIMENTNLSKQQQVSEIMRQMLTQAQTAGQYFTNDQIKEMTR